jgi:hypothetical protein
MASPIDCEGGNMVVSDHGAPARADRTAAPISASDSWRGCLAVFAMALVSLQIAVAPVTAADTLSKASTTRATRDEAARSIPLSRLAPEARDRVSAVLNDTSLYRRLPIETVDCEPDLFAFIVNNPDVMVNIWQLMGVTNVSLDRLDADHFRCSDGDGTTAKVEVVYRGSGAQVIYAEGFYDGPLFPKTVRGQCVMILKYASTRAANGRFEETVRLDTFLHVDNIGLEIIAKLFQGVVGRTIDHNFGETVAFMGSMSHTAETNPRGIARVATGNVAPSPTPTITRHKNSATTPVEKPVTMVAVAHTSPHRNSVRRGPKRSPIQPPKIWNSRYG